MPALSPVLAVLLWCATMVAPPASDALAQAYPSRPVTLVSPFPAGSGSDLTARAFAPALGEALGQPVVVENKPGAGGSIGASYVAKSRPDGYTLFLASLSFSVLPSLMELNFDPAKDFDAVTLMGVQKLVMVVPPTLAASSMDDLVSMARAKPGQLNYASAGIGSIGHLTGELLKSERSLDIVHVPFKGTPEALTAIMAGEVQMSLVAMPAAEPQIKAGKVKAIAVTGGQRHPGLPDVPTMAEAGYASMGDSVWYAILVPAGTPGEIVGRLNGALHRALARPDVVERLASAAKMSATTSTSEEAATYVRSQIEKWKKVARQAGVRVRPTK